MAYTRRSYGRRPSGRSTFGTVRSAAMRNRSVARVVRALVPKDYRVRAQPRTSVISRTSAGSSPASEGKLVEGVVRQLVDPCNAPMRKFPDKYRGKSTLLKSVHVEPFIADAQGERGLIVAPMANDSLQFSGSVTYATFTQYDDPLYTTRINNGDYAYIRCVAMCARIQTTAGSNENSGSIRGWCGPNLVPADRTDSMVGLQNKEYIRVDGKAGLEMSWCPSGSGDLVPYVGSTTYGIQTNIEEVPTQYGSALHFDVVGADVGTKYDVTITKVYELFVDESAYAIGGTHSPVSTPVVERVMNALDKINWTFVGDAMQAVTPYAAKVATLAGQPGAGAAILAGGNILGRALGELR